MEQGVDRSFRSDYVVDSGAWGEGGFNPALAGSIAELPDVEVVTGFRFAYGGAQSYYGVTPDLCTLGKIIGGGFPLAAIAGRAATSVYSSVRAVDQLRDRQ